MELNRTIIAFTFSCFLLLCAPKKADSQELKNDSAREVYERKLQLLRESTRKKIESSPALIRVYFLIDGVKQKKVLSIDVLRNGNIQKSYNDSIIFLDTSFKLSDKLQFRTCIDGTTVESDSIKFSSLRHGGKIFFGIVRNYAKEKRIFLNADSYGLDDDFYWQRRLFMTATREGDIHYLKGNYMAFYSFAHSDWHPLVYSRYFFKKMSN
jgi:hypothetical protein